MRASENEGETGGSNASFTESIGVSSIYRAWVDATSGGPAASRVFSLASDVRRFVSENRQAKADNGEAHGTVASSSSISTPTPAAFPGGSFSGFTSKESRKKGVEGG